MKSSPSIWHYVVNVKSTVKISSVFVAFLENMNFNSREDWFIKNSTKVISVLLLSLVRLFKNQSLEKQRFMMITCQGNFFFLTRDHFFMGGWYHIRSWIAYIARVKIGVLGLLSDRLDVIKMMEAT